MTNQRSLIELQRHCARMLKRAEQMGRLERNYAGFFKGNTHGLSLHEQVNVCICAPCGAVLRKWILFTFLCSTRLAAMDDGRVIAL